MKRSTKIILFVVAVLISAVGTLSWFSRGDLALKQQLSESGQFLITNNDKLLATVTMKDLEKIGLTEFETTMDTSLTDPAKTIFTGTELQKVLEYKRIQLRANNSKANLLNNDAETEVICNLCEVKGLDNYISPISCNEIYQQGKVYICVAMDGRPLGTKESGGMGPFLMVVTGESFSTRWCKYVERINFR